jgi:aldose 1-epimerase
VSESGPSVRAERFGTLPDGRAVELYTLARGPLEVRIATHGATIVSLHAPDRDGVAGDVVLGFDALDGYLARSYLDKSPYFGAVVGRYGNRIARGRFTLDGVEHRLTTNDGPNHLHGGARGFDKRLWSAAPVDGGAGVAMSLESPDGEEGYPGALSARVVYALPDDGVLSVDYAATTDRATPVNLTQHTYWNLTAGLAPTILGHVLTLHAEHYTPTDATLIPTGELAPVAGTPFDFRAPTGVGARVSHRHPQLEVAKGYDHNFVLASPAASGLRHAARVEEPLSGRVLDVHTTEPGIQFYSGNFLDGTIRGKGGRTYHHRGGLCLETQHFPDSPNHPAFPSTVLRPGEEYRSRTVFSFSTAHTALRAAH